jgi:hypothetical protein
MKAWAYLQTFMTGHDYFHFYILALSNFESYFYHSTTCIKGTYIVMKLHIYPYFHNFTQISHNSNHTPHFSY